MGDDQLRQALAMARQTAQTLRAAERDALDALHNQSDAATHRSKMIEKCELLAGLADKTAPLLQHGNHTAKELLAGLNDFARRANTALDLESIFFMTALLYPEDYHDGDPNDLERFLAKFE